ncbi:AAA family ATPase [Ruthenibacterium lactatiformans]|mgnify:FL=1|nr:AAA family ATPase [Ruthenibacterium lactatiformans]MBN3016287.1 AAA family ATPase [Ruthenibacterium lactatiformans]
MGDTEETAKEIQKYLTVAKARLNTVQTGNFYPELRNTKDVLFACMYAHKHNDVALVCGDAGAGKTTALNYYAKNNAGVIMVTANACTPSATAILKMICAELGKPAPGRRDALMNLLVEQLHGTNRLIIVDEADHLSFSALQAVRNLNDLAGVGIVFSGNDKIYLQMTSPRKGYEFDQIRTRIIVRKKVHNEYTVEEIKGVFGCSGEAEQAFLLKLSSAESLRTAKKIFQLAREAATAAHVPFNAGLLRRTQREFLGVDI